MKKYRQRGVKREHHLIDGFADVFEAIARLPSVRSVIPGRIVRAGSGRSLGLFVQYPTQAGLKCLAKSGACIQEVFIVSDAPQAAWQEMREAGLVER